MGYCTKYKLNWSRLETVNKTKPCEHPEANGNKFCPVCGLSVGFISPSRLIGDFITKNQEDFYAIGASGESLDAVKWYDHERHMKVLSKKFPTVLFTLNGEGEESGDIWNKYFLNGKVQVAKATLSFEAFDESKLK